MTRLTDPLNRKPKRSTGGRAKPSSSGGAPPAPKPKPEPLHTFWRWVLVGLAAILLGVAAYAWFSPPTKVEFAPQATGAKDATEDVEVRSETTTVLLIGLAIFLVVIAANGRKLTSVEIAGGKVSTDQAAGEAGEKAKGEAESRGLDEEAAREAARNARAQVYAHAVDGDVEALDIEEIAASAVDQVESQRT